MLKFISKPKPAEIMSFYKWFQKIFKINALKFGKDYE